MSGIDSIGLPPLVYGRSLDRTAPAEDAARAPETLSFTRDWFSFDDWSGLDAVIRIADGAVAAATDTVQDVKNAPQNKKNREAAESNMMTGAHEIFTGLSFELTEQKIRWGNVERAPDVGEMTGEILGRIVAPQ